jgi:hypothetical protein
MKERMVPKTAKLNCMAETIIPDIKAIKAVFNRVVFPPKNLTDKYNGMEDMMKANRVIIADIITVSIEAILLEVSSLIYKFNHDVKFFFRKDF